MKKALELKFSTHSKPHNRGFGWLNILDNIKVLKGKLLVLSNNVLYWLLNDGTVKTSYLQEYFPGTLVILYLNTLNLPTKEKEFSDEMTIL